MENNSWKNNILHTLCYTTYKSVIGVNSYIFKKSNIIRMIHTHAEVAQYRTATEFINQMTTKNLILTITDSKNIMLRMCDTQL